MNRLTSAKVSVSTVQSDSADTVDADSFWRTDSTDNDNASFIAGSSAVSVD